MRVVLNVPYAEKDQAKALGAEWNPSLKKWWLHNPKSLEPFMRWLPVEHHFKPKPKKSRLRLSGLTQGQPMDCCTCAVLPWEDCEHTQYGPDW